jgi:hypothetical protein
MVVALGEDRVSAKALQAYLVENMLHGEMSEDLGWRVRQWWMTPNKCNESMPSMLRRDCELSLRAQTLNKLYFLNVDT